MDPLTHALTSYALCRAIYRGTSPLAAPLLIVAGLLPDLDVLSFLAGPRAFVIYDGALTHSLLVAALLAVAAAIAFFLLGRKFGKNRLSLSASVGLASLGVAAHLLLDLCGSFPVRLLWPFSQRQFDWDFVPLIDPLILLLLFAGLFLPALAKLVSEEIGERRKSPRGRAGAQIALGLVMAFIAARGILHLRATTLLLSREYRGSPPITVIALPSDWPLAWHGIVDTAAAFEELSVPLGPAGNFDPDHSIRRFKPESSPALDAAANTRVAHAFMAFARLPLASVQLAGNGTAHIELHDLAAIYQSHLLPKPMARIEISANLRVLDATLDWQSPLP